MKNLRVLVWLIALLTIFQLSTAFQDKKESKKGTPGQALLGTWQATEEGETITLVFKSANILVFDGEESEYRLISGVIRVREEFGETDYPYVLKGDILTIKFPEGEQIQFRKMKSGQGLAATSPAGGRNENHLLVGKFMSYSSASSMSGSSSWTMYATFDGRGNFSWSSESAHSGEAGLAYGADDGNRGTYRVVGDRIIVTFSDGSTDEGVVSERFSDGSIGAFKYGGKTYAR